MAKQSTARKTNYAKGANVPTKGNMTTPHPPDEQDQRRVAPKSGQRDKTPFGKGKAKGA